MSGKDSAAKMDHSLGTNHLVVCCDVGQLTFDLGFQLVTLGSIKCLNRNLTGFQVQKKPLKASSELSGSRWALFVETIRVNGLTCFVSVIAF